MTKNPNFYSHLDCIFAKNEHFIAVIIYCDRAFQYIVVLAKVDESEYVYHIKAIFCLLSDNRLVGALNPSCVQKQN